MYCNWVDKILNSLENILLLIPVFYLRFKNEFSLTKTLKYKCKHKNSQSLKIKQLEKCHKYIFVLINWWVQFSLLTLLQKSAALILSSLWSWLECKIFFTLDGRWIKQSSQWILSLWCHSSSSSPSNILQSFECFSSSSKILGI